MKGNVYQMMLEETFYLLIRATKELMNKIREIVIMIDKILDIYNTIDEGHFEKLLKNDNSKNTMPSSKYSFITEKLCLIKNQLQDQYNIYSEIVYKIYSFSELGLKSGLKIGSIASVNINITMNPLLDQASNCEKLSNQIIDHIKIMEEIYVLRDIDTDLIHFYKEMDEYYISSKDLSALFAKTCCILNGINDDYNRELKICCKPIRSSLDGYSTTKSKIILNEVEFSAVAPKSFLKGNYSIVNIVAYENSFRHMVDELIKRTDDKKQETLSGVHKVKHGSKVKILLSSPDTLITNNEETREWQGKYLNFTFAVFLPEQYQKQQILFNALVYINDIIATRLSFVAECSSLREQKIEMVRKDIVSAFVSYASQDRRCVAAIVTGMRKARPDMDVFFDVDSLRSGEYWKDILFQEIDRRDIFFLCWSHFAQQSKWVDKEWRYALNKKGIDFIEPIPIEPPNICPPPNELENKHFGDNLIYVINAKELEY